MEISSFQSYLIILFIVLIIISIFVFRQFIKTRSEELNLVKFEQKGLDSLTQATELYEFGSIQIKKRLYSFFYLLTEETIFSKHFGSFNAN